MASILTISGQILLLLCAIWMLKAWRIKDDVPGWYAAAFCSGLLVASFAGSVLLAHIIDLTPMFWFEQLALYAAFPLLSFVLLALVFSINWPREAWGRILLGVCGIYWVAQQTHHLDYLLMISALLSLIAMMKLLLTAQGSSTQASIALSVGAFACLIIVLNGLANIQGVYGMSGFNNEGAEVVSNLSTQWPQELGLGLLLIAINRALLLHFRAHAKQN